MVNDPDLTLNEKRAILASWASDACAVEAAPDLRAGPPGSTVRFDDIMEALWILDRQTNGDEYRRVLHCPRVLQRFQKRRQQHRYLASATVEWSFVCGVGTIRGSQTLTFFCDLATVMSDEERIPAGLPKL